MKMKITPPGTTTVNLTRCNGDDSESRRAETTRTIINTSSSKVLSPAMVSVVLAVLSVVFGAVPSHGFSAVPAAAATATTYSGTTPVTTTLVLSEEDCVRDQLGYLPGNYVGVSAWKKKSKDSRRRGIRIGTNTTVAEGNPCSTTADMIPVAIQTYPLNGGAKRRQNKAKLPVNTNTNQEENQQQQQHKTEQKSVVQSPFPTLFWLTCPDISKAVANLEGRGFVKIFEETLNSNPSLAQRLFSCHEEYAQLRWRSLTEVDRNTLKCSSSSSSSLTPSLQRMRNMMECSGISGTNFTDISSWDSDYAEKAAAASNAAVDDDAAAAAAAAANQVSECCGDDEPPTTKETAASPGIIVAAAVVAKVPPIKCLHAHYAHYRSTVSLDSTRHINPVGELIHRQLELDFPDLDL
jgi:hypothetical protein